MRYGPSAAAAALLSLALIVPGCGEEGTATAGGEKPTGGKPASAAVETRPGSPAAAKRCGRTLGDLLDSIESLANTLAVGLAYEQYVDWVNRVRAAYADVPADRLGIFCLAEVAAPSERALNLYIDAANEWGDCLATTSCDTESIEPELQRKWERASARLAQSRSALRQLRS